MKEARIKHKKITVVGTEMDSLIFLCVWCWDRTLGLAHGRQTLYLHLYPWIITSNFLLCAYITLNFKKKIVDDSY